MNANKISNLTINIHVDDQCRASNNNHPAVRIETNTVQVLYPDVAKQLPSVPVCHKQDIPNENIDRIIAANLEE